MNDLVREYRETMHADVLHLWAKDAVAEITRLQALVDEYREAVKPVDPRSLGEAIVNASDVADETLAINGKVLVMSPESAITINLVKLATALATMEKQT
jgi:hypothetical protein